MKFYGKISPILLLIAALLVSGCSSVQEELSSTMFIVQGDQQYTQMENIDGLWVGYIDMNKSHTTIMFADSEVWVSGSTVNMYGYKQERDLLFYPIQEVPLDKQIFAVSSVPPDVRLIMIKSVPTGRIKVTFDEQKLTFSLSG